MMTALEMLQVAGLVLVTAFGRAALMLVAFAVLAAPGVAYAHFVHAVQGSWHRHHPVHAANHA